MSHFDGKTDPSYYVARLDPDDLQNEKEKRLYIDYKTVHGSDPFHVMVFLPELNYFLASNKICVCNDCLDMNFENCPSFQWYELQVGKLNEKATQSKSIIPLDKLDSNLYSMAIKGSIFAVRADNVFINYFLLLCEVEVVEHLDNEKPHTDDAGQIMYYGTKYITGKYLEVSNFTNRYHEFKIQRKNIAVIGETVFFIFLTTTQ